MTTLTPLLLCFPLSVDDDLKNVDSVLLCGADPDLRLPFGGAGRLETLLEHSESTKAK